MTLRTAALALLTLSLLAAPLVAKESNSAQADLDKATELKINATDLKQLNEVIQLLDSALDKGLDEGNADFAEEMLVGSLMQRASAVAGIVLKQAEVMKQAGADPLQNPQFLQLRMMALTDLGRVVALEPTEADANLLIGRLYSMSQAPGDLVAARDALTKVIDAQGVDPTKQAQAYALRSLARSDPDDRVADLDKAIEIEPNKVEFLVLRARHHQGAEQPDKAMADVQKAIELAPDNASFYQLKALILLSQDKLEEAIASFDKATELAPDDIASYQMRSQVFDKMGDPEKALAQLEKAIELKPDNPNTLLLRMNLLFKSERYDEALADIDNILAKQPGSVQARVIRTQILERMGRDEEALAGLEELAAALPNQPEIHVQLAAHYMDAKQPSKAIAALSKVLELAPDNQLSLRLRGDMYLSTGKHAEALADFAKAYELTPDDSGLLNNYAWTLATSPFDELRDGPQAVKFAERACELTEYEDPGILSTLAAAYAESGDFDKAIEWSQKSVDLSVANDTPEQTEALEKELATYKAGKPVRELKQDQDANPSEEKALEETEPSGAARRGRLISEVRAVSAKSP